MSVMPDTGFEPTIAIALAATVVKRKAMTVTSSIATRANMILFITPSQKNTKVMSIDSMEPMPMSLKEISLRVRNGSEASAPLPFSSFAASPTAPVISPHDFIIPITPAIAMPPIPMLRA